MLMRPARMLSRVYHRDVTRPCDRMDRNVTSHLGDQMRTVPPYRGGMSVQHFFNKLERRALFRAGAIALGAMIMLVASLSWHSAATFAMKQAASTQVKGPKPGTYSRHAAWPAPKAVPLPTSGPPGSCGPWAGANSTQARTVASHG